MLKNRQEEKPLLKKWPWETSIECNQKSTTYCWHCCANRKKGNNCYKGTGDNAKTRQDLSSPKPTEKVAKDYQWLSKLTHVIKEGVD